MNARVFPVAEKASSVNVYDVFTRPSVLKSPSVVSLSKKNDKFLGWGRKMGADYE
jgi:hypothetical protein